jgi:hypothetical protein
MEHFCNHGICFPGNCAIRSAFEEFYEIGKRTPCVYPAAADGQITALSAKLMAELVDVCNNGAGEIF